MHNRSYQQEPPHQHDPDDLVFGLLILLAATAAVVVAISQYVMWVTP